MVGGVCTVYLDNAFTLWINILVVFAFPQADDKRLNQKPPSPRT